MRAHCSREPATRSSMAAATAAVVRPDSLSGRHKTLDLKRLYEADRSILACKSMTAQAAAVLRRHERHVRGRYELRNFLDLKSQAGLWRAGLRALARPAALPAIVGGLATDKLAAFAARGKPAGGKPEPLRYLLSSRAPLTNSAQLWRQEFNEMVRIVKTEASLAEHGNESAVEDWLKQQVLAAHDAMKADPSRGRPTAEVRASLATEHRRAAKRADGVE